MTFTAFERVRETKKSTIPDRLFNGSTYLGDVWRAGNRCQYGWQGICNCGSLSTPFCDGKMRWVGLLNELHEGWPDGLIGTEEFAVIRAMTVGQFVASKLTALVEIPETKVPIHIGSMGTYWWTLVDLAITVPGEDRENTLMALLNIQRVFNTPLADGSRLGAQQ